MADFLALDQFDIQTVNLNWYDQHYYDSDVVKSANITIDDVTYPDYVWIEGYDGVSYLELDFFGRNITYNAAGDITGGTVNFIDEYDIIGNALLWFIEGVSISAKSIYDALFTPSNADEVAIIQLALAGDDLIILSPFDDRMNGYAGDDIMSGGQGSDTIDGGAGTDTAIYADPIENCVITFQGDTVLVSSPAEGTDRLTGFEFVSFAGTLRSVSSLTDTIRPTIIDFSPADGVADAATAANIVLTFSESIQRGTGVITLRLGSASGTIIEQYDAATSDRLTISGSTLTIDPTNILSAGAHYFVTMEPGSVRDLLGNIYAGSTTYDFITVAPPPSAFTLLGAGGRVTIGGNGAIAGTNDVDDISLLYGAITLDGSFNRGNDIVRMGGNANTNFIARSGPSNAIITDNDDLRVVIPLGVIGMTTVFDDGKRTLVFDGTAKIGAQSFDTNSAPITAPSEGSVPPPGGVAGAQALLIMAGAVLQPGQAAHVTIGGKVRIAGTNDIDVIAIANIGGTLVFDGSFNRGGDIIVLNGNGANYTATRQGLSNMVIASAGEQLTIPIGLVGLTLRFADGDRTLIFQDGKYLVGGQEIIGTGPNQLNAPSAPAGETVSSDAGMELWADDASGADTVLSPGSFVSDYEGAQQAVGWNFMTFG